VPATTALIKTLDNFFALPEQTGSGRQELLDGVFVVGPQASLRHQRAAFELGRRLIPALSDRPNLELFANPGDLVLGPCTAMQPDLFVISRPKSSSVNWRNIEPPILVVEILSPQTASRDRGAKRLLYQHAGIPEYWIVDLDARLVERWRPRDQRPEILRDVIPWQPAGSERSFKLELSAFFGRVLE
jgi:Uma2 family endonuclease